MTGYEGNMASDIVQLSNTQSEIKIKLTFTRTNSVLMRPMAMLRWDAIQKLHMHTWKNMPIMHHSKHKHDSQGLPKKNQKTLLASNFCFSELLNCTINK